MKRCKSSIKLNKFVNIPTTHCLFSTPVYPYKLNVDRGSDCTVAAGLAESISEDEDDQKQVSLRRPKMANEKLVRLNSYSDVKWLCFLISDFYSNDLILHKQNIVGCFPCVMHMSVQLLHNLHKKNLLRLKVFYNMGNVGSELQMSRVCALCNSFVNISSLRSYTSITVGV